MITMIFVYEVGIEVRTITVSGLAVESCFSKAELEIPEGSKIVSWY